jgi:hypothetical protein
MEPRMRTPHSTKNKELLTKVKLNINKGNNQGKKHLVASKLIQKGI